MLVLIGYLVACRMYVVCRMRVCGVYGCVWTVRVVVLIPGIVRGNSGVQPEKLNKVRSVGAGQSIDSQSRYVGHKYEKRLQNKKDCWCLCVYCSRDENIAHGLVKGMGEARIPIAMVMMRGDTDGNVEMGPLFSLWEIWTRVCVCVSRII